MSLCCACILTSPKKLSQLLTYLILSTGGRSHTALSRAVAQLFRRKGDYHFIYCLLDYQHRQGPLSLTARAHRGHAVTLLMCSGWLSSCSVPSHWFIYMLHCAVVNRVLSLPSENHSSKHRKKKHLTSPEAENCRMQHFNWQLDRKFCDNISYWFWTTTHMDGSWFKAQS